ncbi:MAG TPA: cysteine desulfurase [Vicinamibacterales bacterium]|nr:cysteine desulfurase [Vicinamibacterales bacterium]
MSSVPTPAVTPAAVELLREEFPILAVRPHGQRLAYLDNAATAQKPREVLAAIAGYYETANANVHRGVHLLSERATAAFEGARADVAAFFNAAHAHEIVFTRNATESINLVAQSWGGAHLKAGDEVLISAMEHHSNIVPWQMICQRTGAQLRVAPFDDRGTLDLEACHRLLGPKTKIVAMSHLSNALGTVNPVADLITAAHAVGAVVLVDGAQASYHMAVDVQTLDADFYVATGHKLYGPTGVGVLYGKTALLDAMPPVMGGGDMIASVTFEQSTWNVLPYKFEAGTPHIAGAVGLGAAVRFLQRVGFGWITAHEADLLTYATEAVGAVPGVRLIGTSPHKASILSFVMDGVHPHDIGTVVDRAGVAIRTGHHCAQPVMARFGVPATARASLAMYNTREDIDQLVAALHEARRVFT